MIFGSEYMKILLINAVCGTGSTGKICAELAEKYEKDGHEVKIAYGRHAYVPEEYQKYAVRIGNGWDVKLHVLKTRIADRHGLGSVRATKRFLEWAENYSPDLLWIHNIHGYYINYEMLFVWIKKHPNMEVKWTLHDCWAFTGHCSHFSYVNCDQWKTICEKCVQKNRYPSSFADYCQDNFKRKKASFTGVENMTLITPSKWLADLVQKSFLKEYEVEVIYNTVNTEIFKPVSGNFRKRYGLSDKKIILGVSNVWDDRKGFDDFIKLSYMLDENYAIVLIGLDNKQMKRIPRNVLGIKRTNNQKELAEIYSVADVFLNLSKEETFGMTTVEAISCGTPAVVLKGTACEEIVNRFGGIAVPYDFEAICRSIFEQTKARENIGYNF